MSYTLDEVWTPIRETIRSDIKAIYSATTKDTIEQDDANKIEAMLYYNMHVLRKCLMLFSDEVTIVELQTLLKETIAHRVYALVVTWKNINASLKLDSGKDIIQESYFNVADTPYVETKQFNESIAISRQLDNMFTHSQAFKDCYNEIKLLVQTIY